jgi:O-antigen/teichoic acid export membrane protein
VQRILFFIQLLVFSGYGMATQQQASNTFSTAHLENDLTGRSVRGGLWTISSQGMQFIMQSISTVVLARLLLPADFGLVAMVTAITGLGQAFADLGLSEATIQHPEISHEQVSTLFWVNVGLGLALTLVTASLAPVLVWFYHEPRLQNITIVVSLTFLIGGLRVQHDALLRRQMRFRALALRDVVCYMFAVPAAIVLAWRGFGYWALVALPMILNAGQMLFSWLLARWIPGVPRRGAQVRPLISFGGSIAASYLLFNINSSADNVLIGWYWGAGPLGLYSRAYNLLMLPVRQLAGPARSVAVPGFSRVQDDPERLARYYLRATNLMLWITALLFGFLFVAAVPVVVLTLGSRWSAAAPVFKILVIAALGQLLLEISLWLFVSRGMGANLLRALAAMTPLIIGSYALGLPFGIKGVALCGSLMLMLIVPALLKVSFRGSILTLYQVGQTMLCPIGAGLAGVCVAELVLHLKPQRNMVAQLALAAISFAGGAVLTTLVPRVRRELTAVKSLFRLAGAGYRQTAPPASA